MIKDIKNTLALMLFTIPLNVHAGIDELGLINPCETHFLGLFELSNSTRITSVESQMKTQLEEVRSNQRFFKYDVKETTKEIKQQFESDAIKLSSKLNRLRSEFSASQQITLPNGKVLSDHAATEYLKIVMSRYLTLLNGSEFLDNLESDFESLENRFDQSYGRLSAINALIDNSSSSEVLESACIALKEASDLQVELPFKDANSLKLYALRQSKPVSDTELDDYLSGGQLAPGQLSFGGTTVDALMDWAKSLIN